MPILSHLRIFVVNWLMTRFTFTRILCKRNLPLNLQPRKRFDKYHVCKRRLNLYRRAWQCHYTPRWLTFIFSLIYSRLVCDERPKGPNEKRTRNLKLVFPILSGEGEILILFLILRFQLLKRERERDFFVWGSDLERESEKKFTIIEKRQRNLKCCSPIFVKRKKNYTTGSPLSKGEREMEIIFSSFKRRNRLWILLKSFPWEGA